MVIMAVMVMVMVMVMMVWLLLPDCLLEQSLIFEIALIFMHRHDTHYIYTVALSSRRIYSHIRP